MKPDFPTAFAATLKHEIGAAQRTRGYALDPDDPGGETVSGISRRHHPDWPGWLLVDECQSHAGFPGNLSLLPELDGLIAQFYREEFWDRLRCDELIDHEVAAELFDTTVNMRGGPQFLQQAINKLNRNGQLYPDIAEDGAIGSQTIGALHLCLRYNPAARLVTVMNIYQGAHYLQRMTDDPTNEKWVGWFDRVTFSHRY